MVQGLCFHHQICQAQPQLQLLWPELALSLLYPDKPRKPPDKPRKFKDKPRKLPDKLRRPQDKQRKLPDKPRRPGKFIYK